MSSAFMKTIKQPVHQIFQRYTMTRPFQLAALLLMALLMQGCAIYGGATDQRLTGTMTDDKTLTTAIKTKLYADSVSSGWNISVYSFYGHVFLVGECPKNLRPTAVKIAKSDARVLSLHTHWFEPLKGETSDFVLATKIRTTLIGTDGLNNTRIETEVNSDRVVLLGVAKDAKERKTAVQAVRNVVGVKTVTSYIMLPKKKDVNYMPTGITYEGLKPSPEAKNQKKPDASKDRPAPAEDVDYDDPNRPNLAPVDEH